MIDALSTWQTIDWGKGRRLPISMNISDSRLLRIRAANRDFSFLFSEFFLLNKKRDKEREKINTNIKNKQKSSSVNQNEKSVRIKADKGGFLIIFLWNGVKHCK